MPEIIVLKEFKFAVGGVSVIEYRPSAEPVEVTDRCAEIALQEKWAKIPKAEKKSESSTESPGAQAS